MNLTQVRQRIAALQAERAALTTNRRTRHEVAAMLDRKLSAWQRGAATLVQREVAALLAGRPASMMRVRITGDSIDLGPLILLAVDPDRLRAALTAALTDAAPGDDVPDAAGRVAEIAAELDRLETIEERLCVEKGAARRPDARPEIILASRDD